MNLLVSLTSDENWVGGGNGTITITNNGSSDLTNWSFNLVTNNFTLTQIWQLKITSTPGTNSILISPNDWNPTIKASETLSSGFSYNGVQFFSYDTTTSGVTIINKVPSTPTDPLAIKLDLTKNKNVFAYYTEWSIYQLQYPTNMIPGDQITHVVYAFMLPNPSQGDFNILSSNYNFPPKPYTAPPTVPEGQLVSQDSYANSINIEGLKILKQKYPHIKVLISVGGWTMSWTLSKVAADPALRKTFVTSLVKFVTSNGFDGLDIDWEFVGKQGIGFNYVDVVNDQPNFIQMLKDLRAELDRVSPTKHLLIASAMGTNPIVIKNYLGTEPYIDHLLLMTYDYYGSFSDGGHLSALYPGGTMDPDFNASKAISNALSIGYAPEKLHMGLPLYGRGWKNIQPLDPTNPIYGSSTMGPADTRSGSAGEPGLTFWKDLKPLITSATSGFIEYFDPIAQAYYMRNATGETWTYDNERSIQFKTTYALDNNLGGLMFWELSNDIRNDQKNSLISIAVDTINKSGIFTKGEIKGETKGDLSLGVKIIIQNNTLDDIVIRANSTYTFEIKN